LIKVAAADALMSGYRRFTRHPKLGDALSLRAKFETPLVKLSASEQQGISTDAGYLEQLPSNKKYEESLVTSSFCATGKQPPPEGWVTERYAYWITELLCLPQEAGPIEMAWVSQESQCGAIQSMQPRSRQRAASVYM
jgi:hypothetical protein